jgi:predicted dehydrogenase
VVCSVRVDRYLSTTSPALRAGKDVYVEWPLGKNLAEAEELLRLKNENGVKKAVVGLQAREAPVIAAIKKIIANGEIGKVLSSEFTSQAGHGGPSTTEATEYIGRREVGGNLVTIHSGHAIDFVQNGMMHLLSFPGTQSQN